MASRFALEAETVTFVHDARAYLIGELHSGSSDGFERVVGLTLGTGLGSAFAIAKQIVTEGEGVPPDGLLWNLPWGGGIVEDAASARTIQNAYNAATGEIWSVLKIASLARTDTRALRIMESFGVSLAQIIRKYCSGFSPEAIVMGGAIAKSADLFLAPMKEELRPAGPLLIASSRIDAAPLIGAAVFWTQVSAASDFAC
jgi:glucokinase